MASVFSHSVTGISKPSAEDVFTFSGWLATIRFVVLGALALLLIVLLPLHRFDFDPRPLLYGLIPVYIVVTFLWLYCTNKKKCVNLLRYQLLTDVFLVTVGIYLTGGTESKFIFAYIAVAFSASLLSMRQSIVTIFSIIFCLGILLVGEQLGVIPSVFGAPPQITEEVDARIGMLIFAMMIVAFQGYFFFSQIRKKDEEILHMKDQFMFIMVHDLKNPNTASKWILEMCSKKSFLSKNPGMKDILPRLQALNERISALTATLLSIAKGDSSLAVVKKERIPIIPVIETIFNEMGAIAEQKQIQLIHEKPVTEQFVIADQTFLKEALSNVISNGIKYNKDSGTLTVSYVLGNDTLTLSIIDQGVGISPEQLEKLFTPYNRGDAAKTDIEGSGIGLFLTKKLVERMEGSVEVKSQVSIGTTVTITLPLSF